MKRNEAGEPVNNRRVHKTLVRDLDYGTLADGTEVTYATFDSHMRGTMFMEFENQSVDDYFVNSNGEVEIQFTGNNVLIRRPPKGWGFQEHYGDLSEDVDCLYETYLCVKNAKYEPCSVS